MADPKKNIDSSVVIRGLDATTFSEMEVFVKDLEERPVERLFRDLPQFAELSAPKFQLVTYVIAGKYKQLSADEKAKMKQVAESHLETVASRESKERMQQVLGRLR